LLAILVFVAHRVPLRGDGLLRAGASGLGQLRLQDTPKRHPYSGLMHRVSTAPSPVLFSLAFEPAGRDAAGSAGSAENTCIRVILRVRMRFMMSSAFQS
jgi:hypothetical protein